MHLSLIIDTNLIQTREKEPNQYISAFEISAFEISRVQCFLIQYTHVNKLTLVWYNPSLNLILTFLAVVEVMCIVQGGILVLND